MDPRTTRTREALLEAAHGLFAERGYDAVATRELVERAGANLAAITYHFGGKRGLYLETVRLAMHQPQIEMAWSALDGPFESAPAAMRSLANFVRAFLPGLLADQEMRSCSCLMLREALQPSEALNDVLEHFVEPRHRLLSAAMHTIAPTLGAVRAERCASSVLGQLLHLHLFRPFHEGMRGKPYSARDVEALVEHVVHFSLRGAGCTDAAISRALAKSGARARPKLAKRQSPPS